MLYGKSVSVGANRLFLAPAGENKKTWALCFERPGLGIDTGDLVRTQEADGKAVTYILLSEEALFGLQQLVTETVKEIHLPAPKETLEDIYTKSAKRLEERLRERKNERSK